VAHEGPFQRHLFFSQNIEEQNDIEYYNPPFWQQHDIFIEDIRLMLGMLLDGHTCKVQRLETAGFFRRWRDV
jgi:hypothetical protein